MKEAIPRRAHTMWFHLTENVSVVMGTRIWVILGEYQLGEGTREPFGIV